MIPGTPYYLLKINMDDMYMGIGPQNKVTDLVCIDFLSWVQTGLNSMT